MSFRVTPTDPPITHPFTPQRAVFVHEDALLNIFKALVPDTRSIISLSLVNRLSHQVTHQSHLWATICSQTGIAIPFDPERSRDAYFYEKGLFFLRQVKEHRTPLMQIVRSPIDLSEKFIHFMQDAYFIVQDKYSVTICDVNDGKIIKTISSDQEIISLCTSQKMIYFSLANRTIQGYNLLDAVPEPFLTLDGHSQEPISASLYQDNRIQLWANDKWLISCSAYTMQQWNSSTGECVCMRSTNGLFPYTINQNKLYAMDSLSDTSLHITDLEECNLLSRSVNVPSGLVKDIDGDNCAFVISEEEVESAEESDFESPSNLARVQILNFSTSTSIDILTQSGLNSTPKVNICGQLAIVVRDGYDPNQTYGLDMEITDPDVIELFDMQTRVSLHRIQKHFLLPLNQRSSISLFHNSILYATEDNEIVKVTFAPPNLKRKLEPQIDGDENNTHISKKGKFSTTQDKI